MLELDPGQIHLWFVFLDELRDGGLLDGYRRLLAEEERQQVGRFFFAKDQRRYLVTRALVRTTLSRYAPIAPEQWSFCRNAYGRPEIANEDSGARKISFNVSHTHGLIMLGVTGESLLGLDTENVRTRQVSPDLATRFFSRAEATALHELPAELRHERFFEYWTLKESYIKARGMGLSIPLNQFGFRFPIEKGIEIAIDPQLNDFASRWRFWQFRPSVDHLAAVCAERLSGVTPRLVLRKTIPSQCDELLDCPLLRESNA